MEVKSHYQQAKCGRFSELLLIKIRSTVLINSIEVLRRVEYEERNQNTQV